MTKDLTATTMRAINWRVVGLIVNARRIARGLDEADLAAELGLCTKTVRRIESQQTCSANTLQKIMLWTGERHEVLSWQGPKLEGMAR